MIRVALLYAVLAATQAQDKFFQKYTFAKTMSQCFGVSAYQNYLYRIADAKRVCGYQEFRRYPDYGRPTFTTGRPFYRPNNINTNYQNFDTNRPSFPGSASERPYFSPATSPPINVILPGRYPISTSDRPFTNALPPLRMDFLQGGKQVGNRLYTNQLYDGGAVREAVSLVSDALKNFTCVLGVLDLIDEALNVNYEMITNNYYKSSLDRQLRNDLVDGINYCRTLNTCLPEDKSPITFELQRVMAFIKCEKKTRLAACFKHDLRNNIYQFDTSALPDDGNLTTDLEKLMTIIIGSESLDQLELF